MRSALALPLFEVASAHHCPACIAGEDPSTRFDLVVEVCQTNPFRDLSATREDQSRAGAREVEHRLCRSRRVLLNPPGNQHREHTPSHSAPEVRVDR